MTVLIFSLCIGLAREKMPRNNSGQNKQCKNAFEIWCSHKILTGFRSGWSPEIVSGECPKVAESFYPLDLVQK